MSNLAEDKFVHHTLADIVYHVEHEGTYDQTTTSLQKQAEL